MRESESVRDRIEHGRAEESCYRGKKGKQQANKIQLPCGGERARQCKTSSMDIRTDNSKRQALVTGVGKKGKGEN